MDTLTIKIRDNKALKLIHDLESLNLIQIISALPQKPLEKFSSLMAGSISEEQANALQKEVEHMRNPYSLA